MILNAEKSNMQAELIFYKNELAKMCLSSGRTFPIFRQTEGVSSQATSQILSKNSMSNSYLACGPSSIGASAKAFYNPQLFYTGKQHSTCEDKYVCISSLQGGNEDLVSQSMMSNLRKKAAPEATTEIENEEDASTVKRDQE